MSGGGGGGQSGGGSSSGGTAGGGESPSGSSGDGGNSLAASAGAIAAAAAMAQGPFDELAKESGNPAPANMTPSSSAAREAVKRKQQAKAARPSPSAGPIGAARTA